MRGENHNSRLASQKQFVISTLLFSPAGIGKLAAGTGRDRATNVNSCDATNTGAFTGAYTGGAAVSTSRQAAPPDQLPQLVSATPSTSKKRSPDPSASANKRDLRS